MNTRKCEICSANKNKKIYKQNFIIANNNSKINNDNYDVLACSRCGFLYASNIPPQAKYDLFYKENKKYTYFKKVNSIPKAVKEANLYYFSKIDKFLNKENNKINKKRIEILDIGCANGYLLHIFKKNGYKNLHGIDPSPECKILAKNLYGLEIESATISELDIAKKFDLVIISNVLEHLEELNKTIYKIRNLLKENGLLFMSVPDVNNFTKITREPFLEFSLEHINYFTRISLLNLLGKYKLANLHFESKKMIAFGGYTLNSFWKLTNNNHKLINDKFGYDKILKYVGLSKLKLLKLQKKIDVLVKSKEDVVLWGTGSLTSKLLCSTNLRKASIKFCVDNNRSLINKEISGYKILNPKVLLNKNYTVLICSYVYEQEIKKTLKKEYGYKGKILTVS